MDKKPRYKPVNAQRDAFVPLRFDKQILPGTFKTETRQSR